MACGVLGTKGTFSESLTPLPLPLPPERRLLLLLALKLLSVFVLILELLFLLLLLSVIALVLGLGLEFWIPDELEPPALLEAFSVVLAFVSAVFFLVDPRKLYVDVGCGRRTDDEEVEVSVGGMLSVASSAFFLPLPPFTDGFPNSLVLPGGPPLVIPNVLANEDPGGPVLRALVAVSLRRMAPPVVLALPSVFVALAVLLLLLLLVLSLLLLVMVLLIAALGVEGNRRGIDKVGV